MIPDTDTATAINQVPYSQEAEDATIGAILIDPQMYPLIAGIVAPDDFYLHRHQWIFEAYAHLYDKKTPIDFLTVTNELTAMGYLAEIGGPAYLTQLLNYVPTTLHAEAYSRQVKVCAVRRNAINAASKIASLAYDPSQDIETIMAEAQKAIQGAFNGAVSDKTEGIGDIANRLLALFTERMIGKGAVPGIPTGFIDLDKILGGGLQDTDFLILAGRPGMGKSTILDQIAWNAAKVQGRWVYMWTGEMSNDQKGTRIISAQAELEARALRTGTIGDDQYAILQHTVEDMQGVHLQVDETPFMSIPVLRSKLVPMRAAGKLDLVVIDYAGLLSAPGKNALEQSTYLSRGLKQLARELKVPVLAAQQLSRAVEARTEKRPVLSDLRDSGTWEQDADVIMFIWQSNDQYLNVRSLDVAKQRSGPTGSFQLIFQGQYTKFQNAAHNDQMPPGGYFVT
jgi:replicative DNA helicase